MNAPIFRSADTEGTGQMSTNGCSPSSSPILAAPASEQGEREAFEAWLKTDWIGRGYPADLWSAWQARASLRASPAVPAYQPLTDAAPSELQRIHAVVMHVGGDWPDDENDPYTLRHVKWMARELTKRSKA